MEVSEILIIVFTGVVAGSTVAYALLTWRLVSETRRMRESQTEPRVSMRIEFNEGIGHGGMELVIRNEGQGPAQNIKFAFEGDPTYFIEYGQQEPVDQIPVIKNGLRYLGPRQSFRLILGWIFGEAFNRATQMPWTFHVDYESLVGRPRTDTYILDFSQFSDLIVGNRPPLVEIEKHLHSIQKDVRHMTTGFRKIQVITQTKAELRKEQEELRKRRISMGNDSENKTDGAP